MSEKDTGASRSAQRDEDQAAHRGSAAVVAGKRRLYDADVIRAALDKQRGHDQASPPEQWATLAGVIRTLAPIIADRRQRGWTDPMICALLSELGVEVSPATLRVYRSRMREQAGQSVPRPEPDAPPRQRPSVTMPPAESSTPPRAPPQVGLSSDVEPPAEPRSRFNPLVNVDENDI